MLINLDKAKAYVVIVFAKVLKALRGRFGTDGRMRLRISNLITSYFHSASSTAFVPKRENINYIFINLHHAPRSRNNTFK